jgi:predicted amidohydrolase
VHVALGQLAGSQDKAANIETVERLTRLAAAAGAALVVFPEATMFGFGAADEPLVEEAEPLDGPFVSALSRLAAELGLAVVAGMFEPAGDPVRVWNTVVAVGPDGTLLGSYRKIHLYDAFGTSESLRFCAGPIEPLVFEVDGLRIGVLTCYDLRFPELARLLVADEAHLLVVPAAWAHGRFKEEHWSVLLRARAIENTVYVAASGQCGPGYTGRSMLVDPLGCVVAGLGEAEGTAVGEVTLERIGSVREQLPALRHRRLDPLLAGR